MQLQLSGTANDSIVDGPGLRFTIFVQGCPHRCKGCHNPQTHDVKGGKTAEKEEMLEKTRSNPMLDGVTFSGGEPFCQALPLAEIGKKVHELGLNTITYTGYTFEELYARRNESGIGELLEVTDFLIDGPFIEAQKSYQLQFRGSANQRILNCRKSLETGCAVETEFP